MRVFSPVVSRRGKSFPIAARERSLDGQIWGFVDTSKVNADRFIEKLQAAIKKLHRPKDFVVVRKEAPSQIREALQSSSAPQEPTRSGLNGSAEDRVEVEGGVDEINELFHEQGWTNGLPVIPPTDENVRAMLSHSPFSADEELGLLPP